MRISNKHGCWVIPVAAALRTGLMVSVIGWNPSNLVVSQEIEFVLTAKDTTDRLTPQKPLEFSRNGTRAAPHNSLGISNASVVSVNRSILFQEIEGFGGAFTDTASNLFFSMPPSLQDQLINMYFGLDGLHYNMGRLTIGSCDFSLGYYNYDDVDGDVNLTYFNISHDKEKIIPFIHRAMAAANQTIHLVASPWSSPGWMKKNGHMNCDLGPWTCVLKDDPDIQQAWANYFSKYLSAYKANDVNIWGITIQNEPEAMTGNIVYEGMYYTPTTEKAFLVDHLGPVMKAQHPDVNILIYDHNKGHIVTWAEEILADPNSSQYVWGTAFHWYTGPYFENLQKTHDLFPDFKLLSTEATVARQKARTYNDPDWSRGEHYGGEIIDQHGGPTHADPTGGLCEKAIQCGSDAMMIYQDGTLYPQTFYYYMGHISKYVPRGSFRIGLNTNSSAVSATAMKTPDGRIVVVAMNRFDGALSLTLEDSVMGHASTTMPPHSIATFLY